MSKIIKAVAMHDRPKVIHPLDHFLLNPVVMPVNTESLAQIEPAPSNEEAEASRVLQEAAAEAERILMEARLRAEEIYAQASREGFQAGYADGQVQGRQAGAAEISDALNAAVAQAKSIILAAEKEAAQILVDAERQIVEIALAVARKILSHQIAEDSQAIIGLTQAALAKVQDQEQLTIRVSMEDFETLCQAKRDLQQVVGGDKQLTILPDQTLHRGGCIIDTRNGTVDASVDTQFDLLRQAIKDVLP